MQEEARESSSILRQRLLQALGIGILATLAASLLWQLSLFERWENKVWDFEVGKFAHPEKTTDKIRLIFLDQDSLDWGKKQGWAWPWPREVYAPVLDFCRRAGAKSVAFDVIFSEPSEQIDQDAALGEAIRKTPVFVGTVFVGNETGSSTSWPTTIHGSGITFTDHTTVKKTPFTLSHASFPIP